MLSTDSTAMLLSRTATVPSRLGTNRFLEPRVLYLFPCKHMGDTRIRGKCSQLQEGMTPPRQQLSANSFVIPTVAVKMGVGWGM